MGRVQMHIPNRLDAKGTVAAMVDAFGFEHGLSRQIVHDVQVALDEVLDNIISYGLEPSERSEIVIIMQINEREIVIDIEDAGRPFDPLSAPAPDLTGGLRERRENGLGIHFVRNLMDRVQYVRVGEHNRLRLSKMLGPE